MYSSDDFIDYVGKVIVFSVQEHDNVLEQKIATTIKSVCCSEGLASIEVTPFSLLGEHDRVGTTKNIEIHKDDEIRIGVFVEYEHEKYWTTVKGQVIKVY